MYTYKSEFVKVSYKIGGKKDLKSKEPEIDMLNARINERISEGWELAFQSMTMDASMVGYVILLTFRKPIN